MFDGYKMENMPEMINGENIYRMRLFYIKNNSNFNIVIKTVKSYPTHLHFSILIDPFAAISSVLSVNRYCYH
jgi:hypothetical protein